jgi:hypothetical protein
MEKTDNYWAGNGRFQALQNALWELIPPCGEVAEHRRNPKLEKFRRAAKVYYDMFNNGLCNRAREFKPIFGFAAGKYRRPEYRYSIYDFDRIVGPMDEVMDRIILEAAAEQISRLAGLIGKEALAA